MSSVAEFSAWVDAETEDQSNPECGAVAIGAKKLGFKSPSVDVTVPLSAVADVRVEYTPPELGPIPPGRVPITLVYAKADHPAAVTVAAKGDVIRPLTTQVLERLLTGEPIRVRHPVRIGEKDTSVSSERGILAPTDGVVYFRTDRDEKIDISNIVSFERPESSTTPRHLVRATFVRQGLQCRTDIQMTNRRAVSIFGRYLDIQTQLSRP